MSEGLRAADARGRVLWEPPPDAWETTRMGRFLTDVGARRDLAFNDYADAWRWSVDDLEGFWREIWTGLDVLAHAEPEQALADDRMPGAAWFPGARLNYAEHALRRDGGDLAVIAHSQTRAPVELTLDELRDRVARAAAGLRRLGVGPGDRVAAYLPNIPETLVAFLATASLGAVWSSCAPEFGTRSVVERISQIEPKVLLTVDGYRYGAKEVDRTGEVARIRAELPTLEHTVVLPYLRGSLAASGVPDAVAWEDLLAEPDELSFAPVPFDAPLYVLYSSGTTGLPKAIVHGHGGILLEHWKMLALHHDLGPGDRFFWFSTTGWMMWNYLVSGLLVGSTVVLFDGDPGHPDLMALWRLAAETGVTLFGVSAPFLHNCLKAGLTPRRDLDLSALRSIGSTGAPLSPEGFEWCYEAVSEEVLVASASGGTDVCTAFVASCPLLPVRAGELQCRALGAAVEAWDEHGRPVLGERGELVITRPLPSMPVSFWNDEDGARYHDAYFSRWEGVWRHGDWIEIREDGGCVITGRSDATLNRGGVRMGTSEFYRVIESLPEIADSLVVHLDDEEGVGELVLFIAPAEGVEVDDGLVQRLRTTLRSELSPRHVPDEIHALAEIPRTLSGKKVEIPAKRILLGQDPEQVASRDALANPEALDHLVAVAARR